MEIFSVKSPLIKSGDDLFDIFCGVCKEKISEKTVVVIASKIVSVSEGRIVDLSKIKPSSRARSRKFKRYGAYKPDPAFTELVLREADKFWKSEMFLTIKNGIFAPSAGIDTSNAPHGFAILWSKNPYKSAEDFLKKLKKKFHIKRAGVIIADSFIAPLREGVVSIALGYAGFEGVEDLHGEKDIYGKRLRTTRKNIADSLATAASLYIGEANEKTPFVIIKNPAIKFTNKRIAPSEIKTPAEKCLYKALYDLSFRANT